MRVVVSLAASLALSAEGTTDSRATRKWSISASLDGQSRWIAVTARRLQSFGGQDAYFAQSPIRHQATELSSPDPAFAQN